MPGCAVASDTRVTPARPPRSRSFARSCTQPVMSVPAGPPSGGLYLKPPSPGGLCDGVTQMPSALRATRVGHQDRARHRGGRRVAAARVDEHVDAVGRAAPRARSRSPARTARGCRRRGRAGRRCPGSRGTRRSPGVVARMWSSLKLAASDEPRWPLVPNATRWPGSSGSGCTVKYAVTSFATSTRSAEVAGCPARGSLMAPILALHPAWCGPSRRSSRPAIARRCGQRRGAAAR